MNGLHWSWGLSTAVILTVTIALNGRGVRAGWLLGAAVQVINMAFGLAYGQWTFAFLALPAAAFLVNWWRHPRRARPRPLVLPVQPGAPEQEAVAVLNYSEDGVRVQR